MAAADLNALNTEEYILGHRKLRIAIISDTHGYIDENIVELIRNCDLALHAGDVMDAGVLEQMRPRLQSVAVAGNNDAQGLWCKRAHRFVAKLPDVVRIELPGGVIAVEHGHRFGFTQPDHAGLRNAHADARLIVYGHTHKQVIEQEDSPWIANPGAAGVVRNQGGPRCLVLTAHSDDWVIDSHEYPQPQLGNQVQ